MSVYTYWLIVIIVATLPIIAIWVILEWRRELRTANLRMVPKEGTHEEEME